MDNSNAYWQGYGIGQNNGSMPTYDKIRDAHGEAAANWAYSGYNDARGNK